MPQALTHMSICRFLAVAMLGAAITTIILLCGIEPETMQLQVQSLSMCEESCASPVQRPCIDLLPLACRVSGCP